LIGERQVVTFDTSAHNRLAEGGPFSESIFLGIHYGMYFRLAGLSVDEIVSTPDQTKRERLLQCCGRLLTGPSDCLLPSIDLLRALVFAHHSNPSAYDWKAVGVRAMEYERGIQRRKVILSSQLSGETREELSALQKQFRQVLAQLRPDIQSVFEAHRRAPPTRFRDVITQLRGGDATVVWDKSEWAMGKLFYDGYSDAHASQTVIAEFMEVCPPFRAFIYGMLMQWYDRAVRDRHFGERYTAGYSDLAMSVYLPYCDKFVTAEKNGEQEKCLREIVGVANLNTEILSYDIFCDSFLVKP